MGQGKIVTEKQLARRGNGLVESAHRITEQAITGDARYEEAGEFLVAVKSYTVQVEAHHAPMLEKTQLAIDAARGAHGAVKKGEAKLLRPAIEAGGIVKAAMQKFLAVRRERQEKITAAREEKRREAALALRTGGMVTETPTPDKPLKPRPVVAGIAARRVWRFEVMNGAKIDLAYLKPDLVLIRKAVIAFDDVGTAEAAIGGIRVWQEDEIAAGDGR